jgi:RNA polymerase sigma factor (sigma-70 family)
MPGAVCDEELMMRLCSADEGLSDTLFTELFERYRRPVFSWCYRICRDRNAASDLAQEIFFKAWKHRSSFQGNSKLSTWLYVIARNHCLTALKRRSSDPLRFDSPPPPNLRDNVTPAADVAVERLQSCRQLLQLMSRTLEPMEIRVMTLHYAHSVPLADITHDLRLKNPSGAKAYIVNSRRKLKAVMRHPSRQVSAG